MKTLITGGGGFVGQWLARRLLDRGDVVEASGLGAQMTGPPVLTREERRSIRWHPTDFRDAEDVDLLVERAKADVVFHLAGVSFPPDAERSPTTTFDVNALGAVRLLSSIQRRRSAGRSDPLVLLVGSGMQYGRHESDAMPLTEDCDQRPTTVYAASKAAQEIAGLQMFRASGLRVIATRSFNHSGVGHGAQYLLPSLVARARALRNSGGSTLLLGNDVVRDYLHVEDVVSAYIALAERGTVGEAYNVASGVGHTVREIAGLVLSRVGLDVEITTDPSLVRGADVPIAIGSCAKLQKDTGWAPVKTFTDIIDDLLHAEAD